MRDEIDQALKAAMKARDAARTSTLRMMSAAIKDRDIAARGEGRGPAGDAALATLLAKMIRQREESAKAFRDGGRVELADKEEAEIVVIRSFMPRQMDEAAAEAAIAAAIAEVGAATVQDMGKVMTLLKSRHAGEMDFGKASAAVKAKLG
jgi:uncharacterized protein